ncbi:BQ5605_C036g11482 [Microbotryum silenes-dioicae]|uniref:BQ5605_C036g11482 protein n=1 Tax=Microbotryum silenes-dioicae TaxID=796604 RepID=A0A2X0MJE5_9BASI|nr:BQ5605_C036g11482 [Microbotryum silenes-dioicae]
MIVYFGGAPALPVGSKSGHEATQGLEPTAATVTVHDLTVTSQSTPQHQEYEGESKFISIGKIFHKIGTPVPVGSRYFQPEVLFNSTLMFRLPRLIPSRSVLKLGQN